VRYEKPRRFSKADAALAFEGGVPRETSEALISLALYEEDWRWVQEAALRYLEHPNADLRMTAALALGHLARLHGNLDTDRVVPALRKLLSDPITAGRASDALDDIEMFTKDAGC
jgi:HEAT repeat protein